MDVESRSGPYSKRAPLPLIHPMALAGAVITAVPDLRFSRPSPIPVLCLFGLQLVQSRPDFQKILKSGRLLAGIAQ